ncbi:MULTISPECIES: hypothetical protein [Clostridium]|uniref:hypothetical protein n=1 Tax=Clostridium TaxID=1485 RepID=UPI001494A079|nr:MULTISPECIES: hypothetical protein [Clostridium]NOW91087.1 hypothetical protein [Clostridium beijerinckii]
MGNSHISKKKKRKRKFNNKFSNLNSEKLQGKKENPIKKIIKNFITLIKSYYNDVLKVDKNADSIFHLIIGIVFTIISIGMAFIYYFYGRNLEVNNFILKIIYYLILFMFVSSMYIIKINRYARKHIATRKKLKKTIIYFVYSIVLFPLILVFLILSLFTNGLRLDKLFKNSMYLITFAVLGVSTSICLILLIGQFFGNTLSTYWFASTKTLRYFLTFIFFSTINYVIILMFKFLFFFKKKSAKKEDKKILDKELEMVNKQFCLFKYYVIIIVTFILKACEFTDSNTNSWVDALFYSTSLFTLIRTTLNLYEQQSKRN